MLFVSATGLVDGPPQANMDVALSKAVPRFPFPLHNGTPAPGLASEVFMNSGM